LKILLPGTDQQIKLFSVSVDVKGKSILVVGGESIPIAQRFKEAGAEKVEIIAEDYETFINSSLLLGENSDLNIKIMDFANTDFKKDSFDIVYAQGSLSSEGRKEIVKEMKTLIKSGGILCNGEIVKLENDVPAYIKDIFDNSGIDPLTVDDLKKYYTERNFNITYEKNLSYTLKDYYYANLRSLGSAVEDLTENEKSYYKKLIKQIKHESEAYIRLGAKKYMGFYLLIMEKT
jgi:hypothetical protein